jgi:hypothetical protein
VIRASVLVGRPGRDEALLAAGEEEGITVRIDPTDGVHVERLARAG